MGDKSRSTLLRSCVEVSTSDNLTTFLKELGFRSVVSDIMSLTLLVVRSVVQFNGSYINLDWTLDQAVGPWMCTKLASAVEC